MPALLDELQDWTDESLAALKLARVLGLLPEGAGEGEVQQHQLSLWGNDPLSVVLFDVLWDLRSQKVLLYRETDTGWELKWNPEFSPWNPDRKIL
jgi:hypothetical protein